ncbi:hypothetical protein P691DRAFT_782956 [Macrolepiota fuliginosa MF-IS2]|uniref:Uncharacterized protein n=1 Tax=Macrolepiota fuliginosa MF-IS2 TaxID=1400762 RepID=A0A9P5WYI2_9AGAR|nr:hypothetical protein P691DRAFT_782956 [Macrolepiota fuliginosa MF-IS2]
MAELAKAKEEEEHRHKAELAELRAQHWQELEALTSQTPVHQPLPLSLPTAQEMSGPSWPLLPAVPAPPAVPQAVEATCPVPTGNTPQPPLLTRVPATASMVNFKTPAIAPMGGWLHPRPVPVVASAPLPPPIPTALSKSSSKFSVSTTPAIAVLDNPDSSSPSASEGEDEVMIVLPLPPSSRCTCARKPCIPSPTPSSEFHSSNAESDSPLAASSKCPHEPLPASVAKAPQTQQSQDAPSISRASSHRVNLKVAPPPEPEEKPKVASTTRGKSATPSKVKMKPCNNEEFVRLRGIVAPVPILDNAADLFSIPSKEDMGPLANKFPPCNLCLFQHKKCEKHRSQLDKLDQQHIHVSWTQVQGLELLTQMSIASHQALISEFAADIVAAQEYHSNDPDYWVNSGLVMTKYAAEKLFEAAHDVVEDRSELDPITTARRLYHAQGHILKYCSATHGKTPPFWATLPKPAMFMERHQMAQVNMGLDPLPADAPDYVAPGADLPHSMYTPSSAKGWGKRRV